MKFIKLFAISFILSACSTTVLVPTQDLKVDPIWPTPVKPANSIEWLVINVEDSPYVGLTYKDSLDLRIWLEDLKRYIKDSNNMICFYRKHLNDSRCVNEREIDIDGGPVQ